MRWKWNDLYLYAGLSQITIAIDRGNVADTHCSVPLNLLRKLALLSMDKR